MTVTSGIGDPPPQWSPRLHLSCEKSKSGENLRGVVVLSNESNPIIKLQKQVSDHLCGFGIDRNLKQGHPADCQ